MSDADEFNTMRTIEMILSIEPTELIEPKELIGLDRGLVQKLSSRNWYPFGGMGEI